MNERAASMVEFADCTFKYLAPDFDERTAKRELSELNPAWTETKQH